MRCKNNRFRLFKAFNHFPYFSSCLGIHSRCRLVQEYYWWITYRKQKWCWFTQNHLSPYYFTNSWYRKWYSSFHSSWKCTDSCFLHSKQPNFLQSLVYFFLNPSHRYSLQSAVHMQMFLRSKFIPKNIKLRTDSNNLLNRINFIVYR